MFGNLDLDRRQKFHECMDAILGIWSGTAPYNLAGSMEYLTERTMIPEIGRA